MERFFVGCEYPVNWNLVLIGRVIQVGLLKNVVVLVNFECLSNMLPIDIWERGKRPVDAGISLAKSLSVDEGYLQRISASRS